LITRLSLAVLLASVIVVIDAPPVRADPSPGAENTYLNDVKVNMQRYGDTRLQSVNDGDLLAAGRQACQALANGSNPRQQGIDPIIVNYAKQDLCPNASR
jgi:hypothetical protein